MIPFKNCVSKYLSAKTRERTPFHDTSSLNGLFYGPKLAQSYSREVAIVRLKLDRTTDRLETTTV